MALVASAGIGAFLHPSGGDAFRRWLRLVTSWFINPMKHRYMVSLPETSYDHMVTSSCPPLNCQGQPSDSLHRGRMSYVPIDVLVARVSLAEQLKGSCKRLQGHSLAGGFSVYKTCRKLHHIHSMQSVRMTLKNTFSYIFSFHIHVAHVNLSSFLERTYKA